MLKRQNCYLLKKINDTYWLLPYGQAVADQKKGCQLNETGVFIWQTLVHPMSEDELILQLAKHYEISTDELPALSGDIHNFIRTMLQMNFLTEALAPLGLPFFKQMRIADLHISLYGDPDIFPSDFEPFYIETSSDAAFETIAASDSMSDTALASDTVSRFNLLHPDQQIEVVLAAPSWCPPEQVLIKNRELILYEYEDMYRMLFPEMANIFEARMTRDGHYVRLYCRKPVNQTEYKHIFHAIRFFFLYLAGMHGLFALHSASILYRGKAWLFSGHSGMGKSTHTALWHDLTGTPYLNGDLNLIGIKDGHYRIYGIPWCGTSDIFTTETYPLGGIVLLGRASDDHLEPLDDTVKTLRVMQRLISPVWIPAGLEANLTFSSELIQRIPVFHLCCTKNPSAVDVIKAAIDKEEEDRHA